MWEERKSMTTPVLQLEDLTVRFHLKHGQLTAVDGMTFTLHRGETFGLVGESGSGKTVTARAVLRLIPSPPGEIVRGRILFEGHNMLQPTFKGSECTCRFFGLRALYTTHSRDPVRHRAADDGVGHHTPARPLDHLSIIGPVLPGQTRPTRLPPLGSLSRLCSPGSADHGCTGTNEPVVG